MDVKKIFFFIVLLLTGTYSHAQNDSIAVSQMKEAGVYYMKDTTLIEMIPIVPETQSGHTGNILISSETYFIYLGENSEHAFTENPVFYVFIPHKLRKHFFADRFRLIRLSLDNVKIPKKIAKRLKGTRQYLLTKDEATATYYKIMQVEKLNNECFKLYYDRPLKEGHYGIFYHHGGSSMAMPYKVYDFDIIAK